MMPWPLIAVLAIPVLSCALVIAWAFAPRATRNRWYERLAQIAGELS